MFRRRQTEKRTHQLAVRFTDREVAAIKACGEVLSRTLGGAFLPTDVLREAVARLYEQLEPQMPPAEPPTTAAVKGAKM